MRICQYGLVCVFVRGSAHNPRRGEAPQVRDLLPYFNSLILTFATLPPPKHADMPKAAATCCTYSAAATSCRWQRRAACSGRRFLVFTGRRLSGSRRRAPCTGWQHITGMAFRRTVPAPLALRAAQRAARRIGGVLGKTSADARSRRLETSASAAACALGLAKRMPLRLGVTNI